MKKPSANFSQSASQPISKSADLLTPRPSDKLVKIGEASKILGVSIDTLRRWEKSGKITVQRSAGGTRLYPLSVKIGDASKILGVSIDTLRRWEASGKIQTIRSSGGTRLYSLESLKKTTAPSAQPIKQYQNISINTEELLKRIEKSDQTSSTVILGTNEVRTPESGFWTSQNDNKDAQKTPLHLLSSLANKFLIGVALILVVTLGIAGWITASYFKTPKQTQQTLAENVAPEKSNNVLPAGRQVLAVTSASQFFEINSDTQINGTLSVRDSINDLTVEATPSASTFNLTSGNTTLTVTKTAKLDQDVSTTASPTFATPNVTSLTLSSSNNQFSSGGNQFTLPSTTTTLIGKDTTDTLTNKSISGSSNTLTNIPNSALTNSKVTVTAGTNLTGGGDVTLGSSVSLALKDSPSISGSLTVSGVTTLSSTLAVTGATTLSSTLAVTGALTQTGAATFSSTVALSSTSSASGTALCINSSNQIVTCSTGSSVSGSGSAGSLAFWSSSSALTYDASLFYNTTSTNIGIGTSTPNSKLSVNGNAHIGGTYQGISAPTNGLFVDGNVGIGATTSSNKLDVWGNQRITGTLTVDSTSTFGNGLFGYSGVTAPASGLAVSGNLGVGTTSPQGALHVVGQCVAEGTLIRRRRRKKNGQWIEEDIPVEDIKPDDEVLSLNDKTGEWEWHKVEKTMDMGVQKTIKIVTQSGKWIETTSKHPYLTIEKATRQRFDQTNIFDVDLSPRFEEMGTDTVVAMATKKQYATLRITQKEKIAFKKLFKNQPKLYAPTLYALSIVEIIKQIRLQPTQLRIDTDYTGYQRTMERIIRHFYPEIIISFVQVGHGSNADKAALGVFRGKKIATGVGSNLKGFPTAEWLHHEWLHGSATHTIAFAKDYHKFTDLSIKSAVWKKVEYLKPGMWIATGSGWEQIQNKYPTGRKLTYDLQIENTHNFLANDIVAHNTYINGNLGIGVYSGLTVPTNGLAVSGNLGVGITTSNSNLSVAGNAHIGGIRQGIAAPTNGLFVDGNVGIGATTSNNLLDVWGNTRITGNLTVDGTQTFTGASTFSSQILGANGSAAAPEFSFTNLTNAGLWTNGNGLLLTTGGSSTSGITVTGAGNVGIGNTAPGSGLSVSSNAVIGYGNGVTGPSTGLAISGNLGVGTTTANAKLSVIGGGLFGADYGGYTPSTNGLLVEGNVGIGATSAVGYNLDIWGTGRITGNTTLGAALTVAGATTLSSTLAVSGVETLSANNAALSFTGSTPSLTSGSSVFGIFAGGNVGIGTTGNVYGGLTVRGAGTGTNITLQTYGSNLTQGLTALDNGNVGIGTTSPGAKLNIVGASEQLIVQNSSAFTGSSNQLNRLLLESNTGSAQGWFGFNDNTASYAGGGANLVLSNDLSGSIVFNTTSSETERMRITNAGNVGIGLSTANSQLSISNNVHIGSLYQGTVAPTNGLFVDGNVGIGATTSSNKLDVWGNERITGNSQIDGTLTTNGAATFSSTGSFASTLSLPNGSATTPSLNFTNSTGSGLWRAGSNLVALTTNSGTLNAGQTINGLSVDSSGNVGIGTTSPGFALQVNSTTDINTLDLVSTSSTTSIPFASQIFDLKSTGTVTPGFGGSILWRLQNGSGGMNNAGQISSVWTDVDNLVSALDFYTRRQGSANVFAMRIDGSGNLGVGTSLPSQKFQVNTGSSATVITSTGNLGIGITTANSNLSVNGNAHIGGTYQGISAPTNGLFVDGNVGIGATTSTNKLDVWGNQRITGTLTVDQTSTFGGNFTLSSGQFLAPNGTSSLPSYSFTNSTSTGLYSPSSNALALVTNGASTPALTITAFGNVGVGTTAPQGALHVVGQCVTGDTKLKRRKKRSRKLVGMTGPDPKDTSEGASFDSSEVEDEWEDVEIKDIQPGDEILTLDEKTGKFVPSFVRNLMDMGIQKTYLLITETGKQIRTTANHPYLVRGNNLAAGGLFVESNINQKSYNQKQRESYSYFGIEISKINHIFTPSFLNLKAADINNILNPQSTVNNMIFVTDAASVNGSAKAANNHPAARFINSSDNITENTGSIFITNSIAQQWTKVKDLKPGMEIATIDGWEKIVSLKEYAREQTFDIEVENTHNFVGNNIVAHNTYINGNLGIGAYSGLTVPTNGLAVSGNIGIGLTTANSQLSISNNVHIGSLYQGTTAPTNGLFVDGNVGIGATTSSNKLDVWGNQRITGTLTVDSTSTFGGNFTLSSGQFLAPNGTSSLPSYSFTNSTSTGIWSPGANTVALSTGGTEAIRINSSQQLLVGATAAYGPNTPRLEVTGSGSNVYNETVLNTFSAANGYSILRFQTSNSNTIGTQTAVASGRGLGQIGFMGSDGTSFVSSSYIKALVDNTVSTGVVPGRLEFHTYSSTGVDTERMRIDSSGNVGIGLTTANSQLSISNNVHIGSLYQGTTAPTNGLFVDGNVGIGATTSSNKLDVWGNARIAGNLTLDGSVSNLTSTGVFYAANGSASAPSYSFTNLTNAGLWTNGNGLLLTTGGSNTSGITVTGAGNVGIGTTSPSSILHVKSSSPDITLDVSNTANQARYLFDEAGSSVGSIQYTGSTFATTARRSNVEIFANNGDITFWPGATQQVTFKNGGNVGIGTASPLSTLYVNGNAMIGYSSGGPGANMSSSLAISGNLGVGTSSPSQTFQVNTGSSATVITSTGNIGIGITTSNNKLTVVGAANIGGSYTGITAPTNGLLVEGNVGIGATSAAYNLDVWGTGRITGNTTLGGTLTTSGAATFSSTGSFASTLSLANGSATTPALNFTNSTGSGLWRAGSNLIALTTNSGTLNSGQNINGLSVDSSGNVGIGTTGPSVALHIKGSGIFSTVASPALTTSRLHIEGTTNDMTSQLSLTGTSVMSGFIRPSSVGMIFGADTAGFTWRTGVNVGTTGDTGTERMRMDTNGNVGIGLTTANSQLSISNNVHIGSLYQGTTAPTNGLFVDGNVGIGATTSSNKLDVWGNQRITGTLTVDSTSTFGGNFTLSSGQFLAPNGSSSLPSYSFTNSTSTGMYSPSSNALALQTNGASTPPLTVTAGGNVGIGTTAPGQKVSITNGVLQSDSLIRSTGGTATGATGAGIELQQGSGFGLIDAYDRTLSAYQPIRVDGSTVSLAIQSNVKATIDANGNLGIGTASPGSLLGVNGSAAIGTFATNAAPSNGLAVSGNVGIGTTTVNSNLVVVGNTNIGSAYSGVTTPTNGLLVQGNVGIGTTGLGGNGAYNLDVWGTARVTGNTLVNGTLTTSGAATFSSTGSFASTLSLANGSAATPALNFTNSTGAGLWRAGSNLVALTTNSGTLNSGQTINGLSVDSSGNVGIGTTSQGTNLQIIGSTPIQRITPTGSTTASIQFGSTGGSEAYNAINFTPNSGTFSLNLNNTNLFNAAGSGSAGNEFLDIAFDSGAKPAKFGGNGNIYLGNVVTGATNGVASSVFFIGGSGGSFNGNIGIGTTGPASTLQINSGQIFVPNGSASAPSYSFTNSTGSGLWYNNVTNQISLTTAGTYNSGININASGNVGIGVTNATSTLYVNGNAMIGYSSGGPGANMSNSLAVSGNLGVGTSSPSQTFQVNTGSSATVITSTGNLGIGITTSNSNLSVSGNAHIGGIRQGISAPSNGLFVDGNVGIGATTSNNLLDVWGNQRITGTLTVDSNTTIGGNLTVSGTQTFTGSSTFSGQILGANGSASLPEYSFTNLTNAGLWTNGNGLLLTTGGSNTSGITVTGAGNLGIGVTNPVGVLQVNGAAAIGYGSIPTSSLPASGLAVSGNVGIGTTTANAKLSVIGGGLFGADYGGYTPSTNGLLVEGNVGIGATSAVGYNLDVWGTGRITGNTTLGGTLTTSGAATFSSTGSFASTLSLANGSATTPALNFTNDTGVGLWRAASGIVALTSGTPAANHTISGLSVNSSGNVGIGTSSPAGPLDVTGNGYLVIGNGDTGGASNGFGSRGIRFRDLADTATPNGAVIFEASNNTLYIQGGAADQIRFRSSGGADRLILSSTVLVPNVFGGLTLGATTNPWGATYIGAGGNVGIGTTNALAKLTVWGTGTGTSLSFLTTGLNNATQGLAVLDNGNVGIGTTGPIQTFQVNTGSSATVITSTGNIGIGITTSNNKLTVVGAANIGGSYTGITAPTNGLLVEGNVGIGATSAAYNLDVWGTGRITGNTTLGGTLTTSGAATFSSTGSFASTLSLANGSATTPALNFTNSTGSGLWYNNVTNQISLTTAGTLYSGININASGNVGIGTTNAIGAFQVGSTNTNPTLFANSAGNIGIGTSVPQAKLEIDSTTNPQLRVGYDVSDYLTIGSDSTGIISYTAAGSLARHAFATPTWGTVLTIQDSGGQSTFTGNTRIQRTSATAFQVQTAAGGSTYFTVDTSTPAITLAAATTISSALTLSANNAALSFTGTTPSLTSGSSVFGLFAGGNVGIGTTGNLYGALTVRGLGTSTGITLQTYGSNLTQGLTALDNGNVGIGTTATTMASSLNVNGNQVIGSSFIGGAAPSNGLGVQGNVGIGTTTTSNPLTVIGNGNFTGSLGIGIASAPSYNLDIRAGGGGPSLALFNTTGNSNSYIYMGYNNGTVLNTLQSDVKGFHTSGSLAIGQNYDNVNGIDVNGAVSIGFGTSPITAPTNGLAVKQAATIGYNGGAGSGIGTTGLAVSGNVGIGTSSPVSLLQLSGTNGAAILTLTRSNGTSTGSQMGQLVFSAGNASSTQKNWSLLGTEVRDATAGSETGDLFFYTLGSGTITERMRLSGNGNLGIGYDYIANAKLAVNGNVGIGTSSTSQTFQVNTGSSATVITSTGNLGIGITTANSNLSVSGNAHIGGIRQGISAPSNGLFVDGNVGIGATTSNNLLDVWGNQRITGTLTVDSTQTFSGNSTFSGQILGANGSASLPEFSFTNLTNAGLWTNGNGLLLTTGGSNTSGITVTGAGNVGIGTTTPNTRLDVIGNGTYAADFMLGNVGIGTSSPAQTLQVGNTINDDIQVGPAGGVYLVHTATDNSGSSIGFNVLYNGGYKMGASGTGQLFQYGGSNLDLFTTNNPGAGSAPTFTKRVTFDSNGNLGVGTGSPGGKFDVGGTQNSSTQSYFSQIAGTLTITDNGYNEFALFIDTTIAAVNTGNAVGYGLEVNPNFTRGSGNFANQYGIDINPSFAAGTGTRTILNLTNVGAGTAADYALYSVSSAPSYLTGNLGIGTATTTVAPLDVRDTRTGTTLHAYIGSSAGQFGILDNGNVGIGTTATTMASSLNVSGNQVIGSSFIGGVAPSNGLAVQGNVGIGTSTAAYNLSVVGTANITGALTTGTTISPSGQFLAIDGSTSAPGYSFASDTDTGIYRSASNTLDLVVGGAMRLQLDSANSRINISGYDLSFGGNSLATIRNGSGSPQLLFQLGSTEVGRFDASFNFYSGNVGTSLANANLFVAGASGGNVGVGTTGPSQKFQVNTSGSSAFVVTSGGNVGIGFTTPDRSLQIASSVTGFGNALGTILGAAGSQLSLTGNTAGTIGKKLALALDSTNNIGVIQAGANLGVGSSAAYNLSLNPLGGNVGIGTTNPVQTFQVNASGTSAFVVTSGGNVGIGFTTPNQALQVASAPSAATSLANILGANGGQLSLTGNTATTLQKGLQLGMDTTNNFGYLQAGTNIGVGSSAAANLVLDPFGGNVGIGTSGPNAALHIQGSNTAAAAQPSAISGLRLWLKADSLNLADGAAIGTWSDNSGNGLDATQATAANKPTYKKNILNGMPVVRFDGTQTYLETANITQNQPSTMIVVAIRRGNFTSYNRLVWTNSSEGEIGFNNAANQFYAFAGNGGYPTATAADSSWHTLIGVLNTTNSTLRVDGTATTGGNVGTNNMSNIPIDIGGAGGGNVLNGDIAEVMFYNRALSTADMQAIESYLASKYGLSVTGVAQNTITQWSNAAGGAVASISPTGFLFNSNTSSNTAFEVQSTSAVPIFNVDTTNSFVGIGTTNASQTFQVNTSTSNPFVVTSGGNVGIGFTTPDRSLQIASSVTGFGNALGTILGAAGSQLSLTGSTAGTLGKKLALALDSTNNVGVIQAGANLGVGTTAAYTLSLNPLGGNVGIGTTSPSQLFQLNYSSTNPIVMTSGGNVGIGTTSPIDLLQISGNGAGGQTITAAGGTPFLRFQRSGGTLAAPTAVATDNSVGLVAGYGYDGSTYGAMGYFEARAAATATSGSTPGYIRFGTTPSGTSTSIERMRIDQNGNVGIGVTSTTFTTPIIVGTNNATGNGATLTAGGGWTNGSSREFKENFTALDSQDILNKISQLPIMKWNYKLEDASVKHIGPFAEDFYSIFNVGDDPQHISTIDPAGIALVGVQALNTNLQNQQAVINNLISNFTIKDGNVGIGTTSPGYKLDVLGDANISGQLNLGAATIASSSGNLAVQMAADTIAGVPTNFQIKNSLGQNIFQVDSSGNTTLAGTISSGAGAFDVSEDYHVTDSTTEAGDVVSVANTSGVSPGSPEVKSAVIVKSSTPYDNTVLGIVSTKPGLRLSSNTPGGPARSADGSLNDSQEGPDSPGVNSKPVALSGRVPVKFSTMNGNVKKGDFLTSSSIPGVAMKATKPGQVIGKALEDYSGLGGKVLIFVNISYADPGNALASLSLDDQGNLVTPSLKSGKLLISDESLVGYSGLNNSLLSYEFGRTANVDNTPGVKNCASTPGVGCSEVSVNVLGSLKNLDQALVELNAKEATNSARLDAEQARVQASLDAQKANQQEQESRVKSLESNTASQSASLSELRNNIASLSAAITNTPGVKNCDSTPGVDCLGLTPPDILYATGSAQLANLKVTSEATVSGMLASYNLNISNSLKSLGTTTLGNTTVAGDITIDGTLSLENGNELDVIGTLYLQRSPLAESLDIFAGKVIIDKSGNITTQGTIRAKEIVTNRLTINSHPVLDTGSNSIATSSGVVSGASIGTATLPANQTKVTVQTTEASESAKVFITPRTPTDKVLSVTNIKNNESFDVSTLTPSSADINFNWWIVQTE